MPPPSSDEQTKIELVLTDYDHDLADEDDDSLLELLADPVARRHSRFTRLVERRLYGGGLDSGDAGEADSAA